MIEYDIIFQNASPQNSSTILRTILNLSAKVRFNRLRVFMAYATFNGVRHLIDGLEKKMHKWKSVKKEWLISMDFGRTEDTALMFLNKLPNSEIRIPNGLEVINNSLIPNSCFHPKTYIFDKFNQSRNNPSFCYIVTSANLTVSGIHGGEEHASFFLHTNNDSTQKKSISQIKDKVEAWWKETWSCANKLTPRLLHRYSKLRARMPREDKSTSTKPFADSHPLEIDPIIGLKWAQSKCLWVQTYRLYENLGKGNPGNQLDLRRGMRVYFGFSAKSVAPNTNIGKVRIQYNNKPPHLCSIRYGNNYMDKVNLPIPGRDGPANYDNNFVHFERLGTGIFRIKLAKNKAQFLRWKTKSRRQGMLYKFTGGRTYGFYS